MFLIKVDLNVVVDMSDFILELMKKREYIQKYFIKVKNISRDKSSLKLMKKREYIQRYVLISDRDIP